MKYYAVTLKDFNKMLPLIALANKTRKKAAKTSIFKKFTYTSKPEYCL